MSGEIQKSSVAPDPRDHNQAQHARPPPEPQDDPLKAPAGTLRRLARGLLYDSGQADDVVQEAWLTVLKKRAQPEAAAVEESPGFLAGIVKNLARQATRSEARRARRERAAARPEAQPPPDRALERLEMMRSVVDAVRALDEPYPSVLSERYLEDRSVRNIARERGVSPNTVRTQVARGLARLRAKLDRDHHGNLGAFLGALVPIAGPAPGPFGLPTPDGSAI